MDGLSVRTLFILNSLHTGLIGRFRSHFICIARRGTRNVCVTRVSARTSLIISSGPNLGLGINSRFDTSILPDHRNKGLRVGFHRVGLAICNLNSCTFIAATSNRNIIFGRNRDIIVIFTTCRRLRRNLAGALGTIATGTTG